ncbi:hypothetical protein REC12_01125 [Desulfosporosinus sp. PR]|nr:hypothetical protein [Desulfosporosinus sp. PR]
MFARRKNKAEEIFPVKKTWLAQAEALVAPSRKEKKSLGPDSFSFRIF